MRLSAIRWIGSLLGGIVVTALGALWTARPAPFFDQFCVTPPCGLGIAFGLLTAVIGVSLLITGVVLFRRDRELQTVTIAVRGEAEHDAQAINVIEESISRHENPEKHFVEERPRKRSDAFIELGAEEIKVRKAARKRSPARR